MPRTRSSDTSTHAALRSLLAAPEPLTLIALALGLRGLHSLRAACRALQLATRHAERRLRVIDGSRATPLRLELPADPSDLERHPLHMPLYLASLPDGNLLVSKLGSSDLMLVDPALEVKPQTPRARIQTRLTPTTELGDRWSPSTSAAKEIDGELRGVAASADGSIFCVHLGQVALKSVALGGTVPWHHTVQKLRATTPLSNSTMTPAKKRAFPGVKQAGLRRAVQSKEEGPLGGVRLEYPSGVCYDDAGFVFVADVFNHRIVRYDDEHLLPQQTIGSFGFEHGQLFTPYGLAAHGGTLFVADNGNDRVSCFSTTSGGFERTIGTRSGPGRLTQPRDVAVVRSDSHGHTSAHDLLIVSEAHRLSIFEIFSGEPVQVLELLGAGSLWGLSVSSDGEAVYVADNDASGITKLYLL